MRDKEKDLTSQRRKRIEAATDLYKTGHAAEAAKQLLDCLDFFDEEEMDTREYAVLCCNLGSALAESGELKTATKFFEAALAVHEKLGEEHDAALLHFNLGNVYNYSNNWQASVDHYRTALDIFNRLGDRRHEAACLIALGHFFAQLGVVNEVRSYLSRIWSVRRWLTDEDRWSFYTLLFHFARMTKRKRKALSFAEKALAFAVKTGNEAYVRTTQNIRACLLTELGDKTAGMALAEQIHAQSRLDRQSLERSFSLAVMHADMGNLPRALDLLRECLDEVHRRRLQLDGNERYLFMERYAEFGRKYVELLAKRGDWRGAFEASEEVQARTVLDLMFRHQIKRQEGRRITAGANGRLYLNSAVCEEICDFLRDQSTYLLKFFFPRDDLLLAWFISPDGTVIGWDASPGLPHLRHVREKLPSSHYLQSATHIRFNKGKIEVHPPTSEEGIVDSPPDWEEVLIGISRFYEEAISNPARSVLERHAGSLIIIPHMGLDSVPFSILGPSFGPRLGANWAITTIPSASVGLQLDVRRDLSHVVRSNSDLHALLVGDCGPQHVAIPFLPQSEDRFSLLEFCDLPGAKVEIGHLHSVLGGIALTGADATRENVLRHFADSDIIHFATHGLWDPMFSHRSFLLLDEGVMSAMEISEMLTHAELVFLSACQTGLGQPRPDSRIGLAESFLIAGARTVVVSLWPISDMATTAFVEFFYSRLMNGVPPAQALQAAQLEMTSEPELSHVSLWAGFQLCGWSFYPMVNGKVPTLFGGPAFCGGDVLWQAEAGKMFPLQQFRDYVQSSDKGAFIVEDKIYDLPKPGATKAAPDRNT